VVRVLSNPVLAREARVRLRGWQAFCLLGAYAGALGAVVAVLYGAAEGDAVSGPGDAQGFALKAGLIIGMAQTVLAALIAPALMASSISLEREQRTLDVLKTTGMRASAIVLGKLLAGTLPGALMVISSVPLLALCGVSRWDTAGLCCLSLLTLASVGAVSMACSSGARRTTTAAGRAYAIALYLLVGTVATDYLLYLTLGADFPLPLAEVANPWVLALTITDPDVFTSPARMTVFVAGCGALVAMLVAGIVVASLALRKHGDQL
jgi:ABC-2 type transport system permease protein